MNTNSLQSTYPCYSITKYMDVPVEVVLLSPHAVSEDWLTAPEGDAPVKNMDETTIH